jgi:hypothetical protein
MMKLQERLEQLSPFKDYPESEQEKEDLAETAQAIEKDILQLIKEIEDSKTIKFDIAGGDDYKIMGETVVGVDQLIEHNMDGYYNPYQELRLKLKEYFGEKDE